MIHYYLVVFFLLVGCHFLADFPLQGEFLAKGKNRHIGMPGTPWDVCLLAHGSIHGLFVGLVTQSILLGMLEVIAHCVIDYIKCEKLISFRGDQLYHIWCKIAWTVLLELSLSW